MSKIRLVTGHTGEAHVTAADAGSLYAAITGDGQYVLRRGNRFAVSIVNNNTIRLKDGDALMHGRHIRIEPGETVDLTIENGTSGYYRNDLIVIRYTKDASSGVESAELAVIKGTPSTDAAADPEYTIGDVLGGASIQNDMPLYRVMLDGLNIKSVNALATGMPHFSEHVWSRNNPHDVTAAQVGAAEKDHTHTPAQVGAAAANHSHTLDNLSNVHICSSTPESVTNGHWYLVKES